MEDRSLKYYTTIVEEMKRVAEMGILLSNSVKFLRARRNRRTQNYITWLGHPHCTVKGHPLFHVNSIKYNYYNIRVHIVVYSSKYISLNEIQSDNFFVFAGTIIYQSKAYLIMVFSGHSCSVLLWELFTILINARSTRNLERT